MLMGALPPLFEGVARRDRELDCENKMAENMFCKWVYDLKKNVIIAYSSVSKYSDNLVLSLTPAHWT